MALAQDLKKGGPYTKEEKEERRKEVYKMHFEQGKSAVKIAEILGVNRNTVGDDIRYWYSQISQEIGGTNFSFNVISIIHEYELQRSRLLEDLENAESFEDRMRIEKLLFDINNKLGQFITKLMTSEKSISVYYNEELDDISKEEIKEFVRYLIFNVKKYLIRADIVTLSCYMLMNLLYSATFLSIVHLSKFFIPVLYHIHRDENLASSDQFLVIIFRIVHGIGQESSDPKLV